MNKYTFISFWMIIIFSIVGCRGQCLRCLDYHMDEYDKIAKNKVPKKIQKKFTELYPDVASVKWKQCAGVYTFEKSLQNEDKSNFYAEFAYSGKRVVVVFDAVTKEWVAQQFRIFEGKLPSARIHPEKIVRQMSKDANMKVKTIQMLSPESGICDHYRLKVSTDHFLYQEYQQEEFYIINLDALLFVYTPEGKLLQDSDWY